MSGAAFDSLVSDGSVVNGGIVDSSIVGIGCGIGLGSSVQQSILFENVVVGSRCRLHRTIADQGAVISDHSSIGFNADEDRKRGFVVTASGITVIPARYGRSEMRGAAGMIGQNAAEPLKKIFNRETPVEQGCASPRARRSPMRVGRTKKS